MDGFLLHGEHVYITTQLADFKKQWTIWKHFFLGLSQNVKISYGMLVRKVIAAQICYCEDDLDPFLTHTKTVRWCVRRRKGMDSLEIDSWLCVHIFMTNNFLV